MSTVIASNPVANGNGNGNSTKNGSNNSINSQKVDSRCNLIVNYLPQSLKEHDFCQLFAKIGPLKTCKLMYDKQTGYSFGYGFVDYQNIDDATRAIETLNGYQIEHKRLKVAYARPNCEDTKNTNLYIRNLPTTYDENNLNELFSQYGEVVQVRILRDPVTNFSRRIGFVIMSTKQMAQSAMENLDNHVPLNGTEPIYVKYADEEGKKKHGQRNSGGGNFHHHNNSNNSNNNNNNINNNHHHHNAIANSIQNLGKMKSNRGGNNNRFNPMSTNYGFANYSNFATQGAGSTSNFDGLINGFHNAFLNQAAAAQNGTASTHGHHGGHFNNHHHHNNHHTNNNNQHHSGHTNRQHNNNNNHHHHHHQQQQHHNNLGSLANGLLQFDGGAAEKGHVIYVYGIGPHATESDLYTLFQTVGTILRVNVIKNQKSGLGKGYGFVLFEHYEEACYAVQQMNGYIYNNRPLQVAFKASLSKNQ